MRMSSILWYNNENYVFEILLISEQLFTAHY
jgi:hypothetical protein